jgi:hypothetical protein
MCMLFERRCQTAAFRENGLLGPVRHSCKLQLRPLPLCGFILILFGNLHTPHAHGPHLVRRLTRLRRTVLARGAPRRRAELASYGAGYTVLYGLIFGKKIPDFRIAHSPPPHQSDTLLQSLPNPSPPPSPPPYLLRRVDVLGGDASGLTP